MPHKHKRKQGNLDDFDLPPTQIATPLPVNPGRKAKQPPGGRANTGKGRKGKPPRAADDDTPREFRRLMARASGRVQRSGLDDGQDRKKTTKQTTTNDDAGAPPRIQPPRIQPPTIQPGETMAQFSARVNAAIPITSSDTKALKSADADGTKWKKTRKEWKMHKLYDQWREEARRIKEKKEDELEELAAEELESGRLSILTSEHILQEDAMQQQQQQGGKKKRRRADDDDWEDLKRKRREDGGGGGGPLDPGSGSGPPQARLDLSKLKRLGGRPAVSTGLPEPGRG